LRGKIKNNGFEFPVKNTTFLPPNELLELLIEKSYGLMFQERKSYDYEDNPRFDVFFAS